MHVRLILVLEKGCFFLHVYTRVWIDLGGNWAIIIVIADWMVCDMNLVLSYLNSSSTIPIKKMFKQHS